jgi:hypothetical protein
MAKSIKDQTIIGKGIPDGFGTSDNGCGQTYWTSSYLGIANANLSIAKIPDISMDEIQKKKLLGEAKFLRAYYYYYNLVRIFGKIPLLTEPISVTSPELYPQQASLDDIYKLFVEDLVSAESSGLPFIDASEMVSPGAIKSVLSGVYLAMAGFPLQKGKEYYQKAADKAQEVITSNAYLLFPSYSDVHNPAKKNTGENILWRNFKPLLCLLIGRHLLYLIIRESLYTQTKPFPYMQIPILLNLMSLEIKEKRKKSIILQNILSVKKELSR